MSRERLRGDGRFPTTHWSLVVRAGQDAAETRREALEQLLRHYLPALRAHLVYARRLTPDDADDVLQDFVASRVIEKGLVGQADRDLGKFRTYLLAAMNRFLVDHWRRQGAKKRSPGADGLVELGDGAGAVAAPPAVDAFDVTWARGVLSEAIQQMRAECQATGREDMWGVFEGRVLNPILQGAEPAAYEELVARFRFSSPAQASNMLITAKRTFARLLRAVVGQYALGDEAIDSEIRDLHAVLERSRE